MTSNQKKIATGLAVTVAAAAPLLFVSQPVPPTIVLSWTNLPDVDAQYFVTGIQSTTDFVHWQTDVELPYALTNSVKLPRTNQYRFYRAFNRVR